VKGEKKRGGFDAVIGNPPYVLGRETFDNKMKEYLSIHYDVYGGKYDLYIYFTEKAVSLIHEGGRLGYILPNTLLANENATGLRKIILDKTCIEIIKTFNYKVFMKAQVESIILITKNDSSNIDSTIFIDADKKSYVPQTIFSKNDFFRFNLYTDPKAESIIEKIKTISITLGDITEICIGIQLGGSSGKDKKESFLSNSERDIKYKKVLDGKDINRYEKTWKGIYVRYGDWLHRKRNEKYFLNSKIMIRQIGKIPIASYDQNQFYTLNTIYNLIINSDLFSLKYFLGIINSKLGGWFWIQKNYDYKTLFPKIKKSQIESIPIFNINFSNHTDKSRHDKMVKLVDRMLDLHKRLNTAKTPHDRKVLQRQIDAIDKQIDRLVYELYDLTEEEIGIVES
ncbi:MAG: N-6 DNA methylase, partial [Candidatus Marinimicrobia bacterium]|nr:N-6 DNA methylase [Candidatus Neomarinimicrobiota bacterium]